MKDLTFQSPVYFYLLIVVATMIVWYVLKEKDSKATLQFSTLSGFELNPGKWRNLARHGLFLLRIASLSLLIFALARPQSTKHWRNTRTEGIDIMLAIDISSSMLARDFKPDRLDASKDVAIQFISARPNDRMGLVVFSGESFTQCPLTTDHAVLINLFHEIKSGMIEDGTAIGNGLATAINRLKDSKAKSKVIILLTDGVNNKGEIAPLTAAEIAQTLGIRVYTIGVGTMGMAPYPVNTPMGIQYQNMKVKIDEKVLEEIASETGGKYFRATDNNKLISIYKQIDQLEKSKIEVNEISKREEQYVKYALWALVLLLTEGIFRVSLFRTLP